VGSTVSSDGPKRLRFRYAAVCSMCGCAIEPGETAYWDKREHHAACLGCVGDPKQTVHIGHAGGSALAHAEELQVAAVRTAERKWGPTAAAVAAKVIAEDHDVRAWNEGGDGESRLGAYLDREVADVATVLHDRLIPGTKHANIDHIVVAPNGVWVIDAKTYAGEVTRRDAGSLFRPENRLYVGRRDQTKLAGGLSRQVGAVHAALETVPDLAELPINAMLCFIDTGWPLLLRPFDVRGVTVIYPRALRDRIRKGGTFDHDTVARAAFVIAEGLPAAS
jgi:hypothetical protein